MTHDELRAICAGWMSNPADEGTSEYRLAQETIALLDEIDALRANVEVMGEAAVAMRERAERAERERDRYRDIASRVLSETGEQK